MAILPSSKNKMNKQKINTCMPELREAANGSKERFNKYFHKGTVNQVGKIEKAQN